MLSEFVHDAAGSLSPGQLHADNASALAQLMRELGTAPAKDAKSKDTLSALTGHIYRTYHCRGGDNDRSHTDSERPEMSRLLIEQSLVDSLLERIGARTYFELGFAPFDDAPGWPRRFRKGNLVLNCSTADVREDGNDSFSVCMPRCFPFRSRGFVSLAGLAGPVADHAAILRVYLSFDSEASLDAVGQFCRCADAAELRYSLKAIGRALDYTRTDNVVIYLDHDDFPVLKDALADIAAQYSDRVVHAKASIFCKQLHPGIAIAEEPKSAGAGESFGLHRSRLLAEAAARARSNAGSEDITPEDIEASIRSRFSQDDVSANLPFLSFSWVDNYA